MTELTEIGRLYEVASDHEADVLDTLRRKAGFTWRCEHGSDDPFNECGWVNPAGTDTCEDCGTQRSEAA